MIRRKDEFGQSIPGDSPNSKADTRDWSKGILAKLAGITGVLLVMAGCSAQDAQNTETGAPEVEVAASQSPETVITAGNENVPLISEGDKEELEEIRDRMTLGSGLSEEQLAEKVTEIMSDWMMAGATPEAFEGLGSSDNDTYGQEIAKNQAQYIQEWIFGEKPTADAIDFSESMTEQNGEHVAAYLLDLRMGLPIPNNFEEVYESYTPVSNDGQTIVFEVDSISHNNGNRTGREDVYQKLDGSRTTMRYTLKKADDRYIVTQLDSLTSK